MYNPEDLDAAKKLDKAENYEKHAIQVVEAMPKPPSITDDQFAAAKADTACPGAQWSWPRLFPEE